MEFVYVVRRRDLFDRGTVQGFQALTPQDLETSFLERIHSNGFFVERGHAENDSSLKQIIPYCIVVDRQCLEAVSSDSEVITAASMRVLCLRRLGKQGETRLHDKLSIGIGGHLNPVDLTITNPKPSRDLKDPSRRKIISNGVVREVTEELEIEASENLQPRPVGVLNDDSTPVGSVHFGLVYAIAAPTNLGIREKENMAGEWREWRTLARDERNGANFETWSSFLLRMLPEHHVAESLRTRLQRGAPSKLREDTATGEPA